jgi:hypothetical protein
VVMVGNSLAREGLNSPCNRGFLCAPNQTSSGSFRFSAVGRLDHVQLRLFVEAVISSHIFSLHPSGLFIDT